MNLLALPFYHFFTSLRDPESVYRQLFLQKIESAGYTNLPFLANFCALQVYTDDYPATPRTYHFAIFTNFRPPAGLRRQLARHSMGLPVLPFYHFLPILAPLQLYTAH